MLNAVKQPARIHLHIGKGPQKLTVPCYNISWKRGELSTVVSISHIPTIEHNRTVCRHLLTNLFLNYDCQDSELLHDGIEGDRVMAPFFRMIFSPPNKMVEDQARPIRASSVFVRFSSKT